MAIRFADRIEPHLGAASIINCCLIPTPQAAQRALRWSEAHYITGWGSLREDLSFDRRDNARGVPKCVVVDEAFTWGEERAPNMASGGRIYETHVRGYTIRHPELPQPFVGYLRGAGRHDKVLAYLKALGITAVELLPVQAFADDHFR